MTKRQVSPPEPARVGERAFVEAVDERLGGAADADELSEVVTEIVAELHNDRELLQRYENDDESLSPIERARVQRFDPRNVTLESEYYAELELQQEEWRRSKPLQWLWRQFDNSPLADAVDIGHAFRQTVANHLFASCGDDCRFFRGISMTYGHNISVGDNVVIHDDVHLDDRGELSIGNAVSVSDGVHLYSHDHDIVDQTEVTNYRTIIEDDVRLTFDAMVRAGCRVGENALVGARGVVQSDVPAHHIAVGMPAESIAVKPGWEEAALDVDEAGADRRESRRITYDFEQKSFDRFDEFDRNRQPPQ